MAHNPNTRRARDTIGAIILIVFIAAALLVASINYRAGAAVLGGALAAVLIALMIRAIARSRRRVLLIVLMIPVILLGLVVLFGVFLMSRSRQSASPIILCPVAEHYIVIDPETSKLQGFQIHEAVTLVEGVVGYQPAKVTPPKTEPSAAASSTTASSGRLRSLPLKEGMVRKAHGALQPSDILR